jgi:hypothetical protein
MVVLGRKPSLPQIIARLYQPGPGERGRENGWLVPDQPDKLAAYAKINAYHIQMLNYFLKKLDSIPDGDATLLDRTALLMGSGMSDGNVHNNYSVPAIVVGGKSLGIRGNRHVRYPKGTPLSKPDAGQHESIRHQFGQVQQQQRRNRFDDALDAATRFGPKLSPDSSKCSDTGHCSNPCLG